MVRLLYGDQYIGAGAILAINIWTGIFVSLGVARSKWLIIENLQSYSLVCFGIGVVVNVMLNLLLMPIFKAQGGALAALASQVTVSIIAPALFSKTRISTIMIMQSFLPIRAFCLIWRQLRSN
jgi:O-antigen/teichoic acid export membrane protein